jgi:hypothetical protein
MDRDTIVQLLQIATSLIVPNTADSAKTIEKNYKKIEELFKKSYEED